jgi:hypothetical protein
MAHVEELDRRHHEWTCGACQRVLPVETLNHIHAGRLVRCANCRAYLYTDREVDDIVSKVGPKEAKEVKERKTKAKKAASAEDNLKAAANVDGSTTPKIGAKSGPKPSAGKSGGATAAPAPAASDAQPAN